MLEMGHRAAVLHGLLLFSRLAAGSVFEERDVGVSTPPMTAGTVMSRDTGL
jgi:hypothetical protein